MTARILAWVPVCKIFFFPTLGSSNKYGKYFSSSQFLSGSLQSWRKSTILVSCKNSVLETLPKKKNGFTLPAACWESGENNPWKLSSSNLTSLEESSPLHGTALILSSRLLPLASFHHCRWSAGHVCYQPALFSCTSNALFE